MTGRVWTPGQAVQVRGALNGQLQAAVIIAQPLTTNGAPARVVRVRYVNTGVERDVAVSRLVAS